MSQLTTLQSHVLFIVSEHEPVTASEIDDHLLLDRGRSQSILRSLERRALIGATYTETRPGHRGRAWRITTRGENTLTEEAERDA